MAPRLTTALAAGLLVAAMAPAPVFGQTDFSIRLGNDNAISRLDSEARRIDSRLSVLGRVPGIAPDGGTAARIRLLQRRLGQIEAERRSLSRSPTRPSLSVGTAERTGPDLTISPRVTLMPPADPDWHPAESALIGPGDASQRAADYVNALLRANADRQRQ